MVYDPKKHNRKSNRMKGYDYSRPGEYSITICTQNREKLFGEIINKEMVLSKFGEIVRDEWLKSEQIRKEIQLDEFQVMPDHFHAIVRILKTENRRADRPVGSSVIPPMKPRSLSSLMVGFQSSVTVKINRMRNTPGKRVWQYNYNDHIIRNPTDLERIRKYIRNNPENWRE